MYQWARTASGWRIARQGTLLDGGQDDVLYWGPYIYPPLDRPEAVEAESVEDDNAKADKRREVLGDSITFDQFVEVRSQANNDCGVVALANILQVPHAQAKTIAFRQGGWSSTSGINPGLFELLLKRYYKMGLAKRPLRNGGLFVMMQPTHVYVVYDGVSYNGPHSGPITDIFEVVSIKE